MEHNTNFNMEHALITARLFALTDQAIDLAEALGDLAERATKALGDHSPTDE